MNTPTPIRRPSLLLAAVLLALPVSAGERGVAHAPDEGGVLRSSGADYRAEFAPGAATFVPHLGARAPRTLPVAFRLDAIERGGAHVPFDRDAAPARAADAVAYDRGPLVERYAIAPGSIEQVFVIDEPIEGSGDLLVRLAVDTELAPGEGELGLEFRGEHGGVRYGRAVAVDARGRRTDAPTRLREGPGGPAIEIAVPARVLAEAAYPLAIDPVIATFDVDASADDDFRPDVAFDATTNRFLMVFEEVVSSTDHDVRAVLLDSTGAFVSAVMVDSTTEDWRAPKVANNAAADQFLVVADVGGALVRARTVSAVTLAMGARLSVANGHSPDVGGDPASNSPFHYCVAYLNFGEGIGRFVSSRIVSTAGALVGTAQLLDAAGGGTLPHVSVSKSNNGSNWNVVWEKDGDIHGTRISRTGAITTPTFPIDTSASVDSRPSAATSIELGDRWLVAYERDVGANRNIVARSMDDDVSEDFVDLSTLEGASPIADQFAPAADSDGRSYAIAYTEFVGFPSADEDVRVATLTRVGNQIHLTEGSATLSGSSSVDEREPQIASLEGAGGEFRRFAAVWSVETGGTQLRDVEAGLYTPDDFTSVCFPGQDGVIPCPCNNPPGSSGRGCNNSSATGGARLTKTGSASVSADTLVLQATGETPTAVSIVTQGSGVLFAGTTFGQGVRCTGGTITRLYTKNAVGGAVSAPAPGDPSISARSAAVGQPIVAGSSKQYYVEYRDNTILGGCPAASNFNTTQTGSVIWRP